MFKVETLTAPSFAPVTSADMLQFLHLNDDVEAALLDQFVSGASDLFTSHTGVVLCSSTLRLRLDHWPTAYYGMNDQPSYAPGFYGYPDVPNVLLPVTQIFIPRSPVTAVSLVEYLDTAGTWQSLTGWTADTVSNPARVVLPTNLPALNQTQKPSVRVTFTAGYASALAIPALALIGVKLLASDWYNDRSIEGTATDRWLSLTSRFNMGLSGDWNR